MKYSYIIAQTRHRSGGDGGVVEERKEKDGRWSCGLKMGQLKKHHKLA